MSAVASKERIEGEKDSEKTDAGKANSARKKKPDEDNQNRSKSGNGGGSAGIAGGPSTIEQPAKSTGKKDTPSKGGKNSAKTIRAKVNEQAKERGISLDTKA